MKCINCDKDWMQNLYVKNQQEDILKIQCDLEEKNRRIIEYQNEI